MLTSRNLLVVSRPDFPSTRSIRLPVNSGMMKVFAAFASVEIVLFSSLSIRMTLKFALLSLQVIVSFFAALEPST